MVNYNDHPIVMQPIPKNLASRYTCLVVRGSQRSDIRMKTPLPKGRLQSNTAVVTNLLLKLVTSGDRVSDLCNLYSGESSQLGCLGLVTSPTTLCGLYW